MTRLPSTRANDAPILVVSIAIFRQVSLPKPTGPPVAQFLAAGTFVVDPLPNGKHFLIPVVAGAHGDAESVARLPNCLAINEHHLIKLRLLRLRRVIDSSPEGPINDEASLAIRIHAAPGSCTGTVASSTLCFPSTEDAWGIAYGGADTVPCKDQIEQRIQQVLAAFLRIARPNDQSTLGVRGTDGKFSGAFVSAVEAMNERGCHLGIEVKIEVAHSGFSVPLSAGNVASAASGEMFAFLLAGPIGVGVVSRLFARAQRRRSVRLSDCTRFGRSVAVSIGLKGVRITRVNSGASSQSQMSYRPPHPKQTTNSSLNTS